MTRYYIQRGIETKEISKSTFYRFVRKWHPYYIEGIFKTGVKYKQITFD